MTRRADPIERLRNQRPPQPVPMSYEERVRLFSLIAATEHPSYVAGPTRLRRRLPAAVSLAVVGVIAAVIGVVVAMGTRGTPNASASIEHRLRNLAVIHAKSGARLDTSDATILGTSPTSQGIVYLVTGFRLVSDETGQCIGLMASHALNDSFSQLPESSLYFGNYVCGSGGSSYGTGDLTNADAVFMYGHVPDSRTVRVTLDGPTGSSQLPMRNGYFGTIVPLQPMPTRIVEYDAAGNVTASWNLDPRTFTRSYHEPDQSSPHHTLVGASLPDGTPVSIERSDGEDQFGSYAFWISIANQPAKSALWNVDPNPGSQVPAASFLVGDVLAVGDARLVLIEDIDNSPVTARLDDGTAVPVNLHAVGPERSLALIVLSGEQLSHKLTVSGLVGYADGPKPGSYSVDLTNATVTSSPPPS